MKAPPLPIAGALLACCLAAASRAESAATEALVGGVNLQGMRGANGGSAGVDWVRTTARHVVTGGAQISNVGPSRWAVVRGTVAQHRGRRTSVAGSIDVGPGSTEGERFTYRKFGARLSAPLAARWTLLAESTYVDVDTVSGNVVTLGGETARANGLSFRVQGARSTSGTLDEHGFLLRFDRRAAPPYLLAGVTASSTNNRLTLGAQADAPTTRARQAFVGLSFPLRSGELTVALDLGDVGGLRRSGLAVYVRSPLAAAE